MAHQVYTMAYAGQKPWHGLGNQIDPNSTLEEWSSAAGLDWSVKEAPVHFTMGDVTHTVANRKVLVREDTNHLLSIVSKDYRTVQPSQIIEFFRDLVEAHGFVMDTAGVLKQGERVWGLAKTGKDFTLTGGDTVEGYLLLGTSFDGSLSTTAKFTSIRVVCNNTLELSTSSTGKADIRVPHSRVWNPDQVKMDLGIYADTWEAFHDNVVSLANFRPDREQVDSFLVDVFGNPKLPRNDEEQKNNRAMDMVELLYRGVGMGSTMSSSQGTGWGLVNAVTEFVDHQRGRNQDSRVNQAFFGQGATLKNRAMNRAIELLAA